MLKNTDQKNLKISQYSTFYSTRVISYSTPRLSETSSTQDLSRESVLLPRRRLTSLYDISKRINGIE
jgi:hypothetical protein